MLHQRSISDLVRRGCGAVGAGILLWLVGQGTGCKVGPDYRRPAVETPADWRWKAAEPRDQVPREGWWRIFEDPTLDTLEQTALQGNLELQAALARVEQARALARVSRSELFPALQVSGSYARYRTSGNAPSPVPFPIPSFTQSQWAIPFDLSYEIDLWGRVRRSFEAARYSALGAEAARQSLLLSLQAEIASTYFLLQDTAQEIELFSDAIRLRREAAAIFEQRLATGMVSEYEVQRVRVEVATAEVDLVSAQRRQAEFRNALAVLCGRPPAHFESEVQTNTARIPAVAADLPSALLERRPDVAQAERELAARMAQIGVAKAAFFPSVRLTASGGMLSGEVTDLFDWDSRVWSIGPSISLPLFAGGRNQANLASARAAYEEGVALYRQRLLVAFREVEDSLAAVQFLREEAAARQRAAVAAVEAAKISAARYRAGSIGFLEVVDSEQVRLSNELARVRVANQQRLAVVRLIKALGGGWE